MLAVNVLGCSGSYAAAGGACTGYLVQSTETNVWLDAGPGTLGNLQKRVSLSELDAVVLTHAHPDHWLELPVVANALEWYERRDRLPVYSNSDMAATARAVMGDKAIDKVYDWHTVAVGDEVVVGDQRWTFAQTEHYIPTFAVRVDAEGHSLAFSADTGPAFSLSDLYADGETIDMALIESTFLHRSDHPGALHLSASEAGLMAAKVNVRRLILTHQAPHEDGQAHLAAAAANFSGEIVLAEVGRQYAAPSD